jgi:hypothetical protein
MSELNFGDAMRQYLEKSKIKTGVQALQIKEAWETIMGKTIARYTEKILVVNKTLMVYTTVGPLRQELIYQKPKIIERVNELLGPGTIKDVVIK